MAATLTQKTGRIAALANTGNWASAHPSGAYLVTACANAGTTLQLWSHSSGTFTLLQSQHVDSSSTTRIEWLDSEYLIVKGNSRGITTYKLVGNTLVKQDDMPSTLASSGGPNFTGAQYFVATADGTRVLAIGTSNPMWVLYTHSAGQLTRVSDGLPASNYARYVAAMTSDGLFIVTTTYNGYAYIIQVHKWSGTAYVLQNVTQPTITYSGNHAEFNGDYLAVTSGGTKLSLYKLDRSTGALTDLSIDTLPTGDCLGCSWNGNYLAAGMIGAPYLVWYLLVGDVLVKQTNPTELANTGFRAEWVGNYLVVVHMWSPYAMVYELAIPPKEFTIPKLTLSTTLYTPELQTTVRKYPDVGEFTGESLAAISNFQFVTTNVNEISTGSITTRPGLIGVAELSIAANAVTFHASLTTTTAEALVEALTPGVIISVHVPAATAVLDHNTVTHNIVWANSYTKYAYGNAVELAATANSDLEIQLSVEIVGYAPQVIVTEQEISLSVECVCWQRKTAEGELVLELSVEAICEDAWVDLLSSNIEIPLVVEALMLNAVIQSMSVGVDLKLSCLASTLSIIPVDSGTLQLNCITRLEERICHR